MLTKFLERRLIMDSDGEIMFEKLIELDYYLIESYLDNVGFREENKTYGIGIAKKINSTCFEEMIIENYSICLDETRSTLKILADNSVTPDSLIYVLDDMLGSV